MEIEVESLYESMKHKSEKEVAKHLDALGVRWVYESPVFVYDDEKRPRVWTPDFCLPDIGIYVEVCGSDKFNYEFREKVYKENGVPVVFLHYYKRKNKWKHYLSFRLLEIEEERHSKTNETIGLLEKKGNLKSYKYNMPKEK